MKILKHMLKKLILLPLSSSEELVYMDRFSKSLPLYIQKSDTAPINIAGHMIKFQLINLILAMHVA